MRNTAHTQLPSCARFSRNRFHAQCQLTRYCYLPSGFDWLLLATCLPLSFLVTLALGVLCFFLEISCSCQLITGDLQRALPRSSAHQTLRTCLGCERCAPFSPGTCRVGFLCVTWKLLRVENRVHRWPRHQVHKHKLLCGNGRAGGKTTIAMEGSLFKTQWCSFKIDYPYSILSTGGPRRGRLHRVLYGHRLLVLLQNSS